MIAVNKKFLSGRLHSSFSSLECVFVGIKINTDSLLVCSAYIPPDAHSSVYCDFSLAVEEILATDSSFSKVLITGDFNQPLTNWVNPAVSRLNTSSQALVDLTNVFDLKQVNTVRNKRGVLLDLIFSSDSDSIVHPAIDVLLPLEDDHPALTMDICATHNSCPQKVQLIPDLRRCNLRGVFEWLGNKPYPLINNASAEEDFETFCRDLSDCVISNSPKKRCGFTSFPNWFSSELKSTIIQKKITHKLYKKTLHPSHLLEFKQLRSRCSILTSQCRTKFLNGVDSRITQDPKEFWRHVNQQRKTSSLPAMITHQGMTAGDPEGISKVFADYFSTVFAATNTPPPMYNPTGLKSVSTWRLSTDSIVRKLMELDPHKGPGPDFIPPSVLRFCSPVISPHLAIFFNYFFSKGIFPNCLKSGFIVPIYKSGDRNLAANYRPIVILTALSKVLESLVLDGLQFEFKHQISTRQHGFLSARSTTTNLTTFQHYITSAFSRNNQVDCIYLDFAKAFDRVSHSHLISKLSSIGISGSLILFLESYLRDRLLQVKCGTAVSAPIHASSGVPQGSHLGPFLFNLFINDIGDGLGAQLLLFADDAKLFQEITSRQDIRTLQASIESLERWCSMNLMCLNPTKCVIMTFSRSHRTHYHNYVLNNESLRRVEEFKDLGVITTTTLHPEQHIQHICSRANSTLGFIVRFSRGLSVASLVLLFKTLVRPLLEYNSPVWAPYQQGLISKLERVQERFLRVLGCRLGYEYMDVPITLLMDQYSLTRLQIRRRVADLIFLAKLINGFVDCQELLHEIPFHISARTRSRDTFTRHHYPTNYLKYSTIPRLIRVGNEVGCTLNLFTIHPASLRRQAYQLYSEVEHETDQPT